MLFRVGSCLPTYSRKRRDLHSQRPACEKIFWGYINSVRKPQRFSYYPAKESRNRAERSLSFESARDFEFDTAVIAVDDRRDYGEVREVAVGLMGERVHVLVFTMRGEVCHVISFRKANRREIETYVQALR